MKKLLTVVLVFVSMFAMSQNRIAMYYVNEATIEKILVYDSSYTIDNIDSIVVVYLPNKTIFRKAKNINYYISIDISRQEFRIINSKKEVIATFYSAANASEYIRFKERK